VGPKGRGTNLKAIVLGCETGEIPGIVHKVASPLARIPAVEFAEGRGIKVDIVSPMGNPNYAQELVESLADCDLVCLAGYTRLLPPDVINAHPSRVLNIHPALLPKFGGKGMFGIHVHEAVLAGGESESGCTVHFVTPVYDDGDVILQLKCDVSETDSPQELAARVLELEKVAYPAAIRKVISGAAS
jgi:folate-dependent phosphoribosylglycinamide formyltransferase PurN